MDTEVLGGPPPFKGAEDNMVQPFQLEASNLRGRIVSLGDTLNEILEPHDYPKPVAHLVAETATMALLLSSMLKYEGIFTLQAKGDGPISMIVADVTSDGHVRACASFDPERTEHAREQLAAMKSEEGSQNHLAQLLGKGYIAFTVDQGQHTDRYQGIVELKGSSMTDCVQHYFKQSEQIGTAIKMAVGLRGDQWRSSGIMLQHMPEDEQNPEAGSSNVDEDDWRRTIIFLDSCTEEELLDPDLHPNVLLMRLFHEEGIRVYEPKPVQHKCRCSAERVENVLLSMSDDDLDYMADDGVITMNCEFCTTAYSFKTKDIRKKVKQMTKGG